MNYIEEDKNERDPQFDLAAYFVINITHRTINIESRVHHAVIAIRNLLKKGWTLITIRAELDKFHADYPTLVENIYHMEEILGNKHPPINIMDPDIFYYHNRLRETSKPSKLVLNKETREYERVEEAFYLEMIPCFTLEELMDYWYHSSNMKPNENHKKQDKGKFEYLLRFYDLDEILFSIDIAQAERKKMKHRMLSNAFDLERYIERAKDDIKLKQNTHKIQGINQVIPRKEVL